MGESATIACQPGTFKGESNRHSHNFCINQLPHKNEVVWRVITKTDDVSNITFNVKEHYTYKEDEVRFENIKDGMITEYSPYRNLYVTDVRNVTGHFIVRVETME